MTSPRTPSAKHLVWPVSKLAIGGSWDPDAALRPGQKLMPFERLHIPYEPATTPRISLDEAGIRYPVPAELQPRLAESWTADDSYRTWIIALRRGVKSHAGNELTAEDVKWSWDRTYALKGIGVWRSRRLAGLDSSD